LEKVSIDRDKFPNLFTWFNMVGAVPEEERAKWRPLQKATKARTFAGARRLLYDDVV
jgi:hypothetical protein